MHEALLGLGADGSPRHSSALLAEVEQAAAAAGGWERVGRIAVGVGPGSFVGIRIGIATARALSLSTGLPAMGVCTLDALGRGLTELAPSRNALAVLDARRGEVFAALYAPGGERLWEPLVLAPGALAERLAGLAEPPLAAGPGAVRFRDELASRGAEIPGDEEPAHRIAARHLCVLAEDAASGSKSLDPIYLRPPDAQRWRERDTSQRSE
ncbi:MAG TPA: tRNA (adenosine(37)-N6)-threonylcarbamoyltransferase complex dimerization subunit type 1 TsaB [Solirubrobacterales bacterium]|nr:tRNA (adenosine(37)-N6)-threonylcarbamoyltransferase complex dimerization subunit type 1 TsaB [Solirubrobacterales bacterium]